MINIVGVRFRGGGRLGYFDPDDLEVKAGTHVIAETARGIEYGTVVAAPQQIEEEKAPQPLRPLIRTATAEDDERVKLNHEKEQEALGICREKVRLHGLEMKVIDVEYTFDNNKILFYFTADGRVDFRELVKDLAGIFRTRIELRQIGVRDETRLLGGIGICGRPLCCHTYLTEFAPVSIRMAKEQNLSLNPTKISGVCGRLMCCLKNEEETYVYLTGRLPRVGESVQTADGQHGVVSEVNVLRQRVKVLIDTEGEKELQEFEVGELKFRGKKVQGQKEQNQKEQNQKEQNQKERSEPVQTSASEQGERAQRPARRSEGRPKDRRPKAGASGPAGSAGEEKESRPHRDRYKGNNHRRPRQQADPAGRSSSAQNAGGSTDG